MTPRTTAVRARSDERGFSLIELMIVVTIISIVAAIAQPQMHSVLLKARAADVVADLNAVRVAVLQYQGDRSAWPAETSAGNVPSGLGPFLPNGFSFNQEEYTMDYENMGGTPYTVGLTVVTENSDLGLAVLDLLGKPVLNTGNKYSWIIE